MKHLTIFILFTLPLLSATAQEKKKRPIGYSDTPQQPHSKWKVHDIDRPRPKVVEPGKTAAHPPADAIVLFDGTDLEAWAGTKDPEPKWKIENGYVEVTPTGDIKTKQAFGDMQLHIEWASPSPPQDDSQHRGNSGIFIMDRYEVQVLDCFNNKTYADGQAGGVYGQYPPLVNACRRPGEWQTYDIIFKAPRFKDGEVAQPAYITVVHNGVVTLNNARILGGTTHKKIAPYKEHPPKAPIRLQDHKDKQKVRYRNIWVRELGLHDGQE